ncbi:MAG TPA: CapA family protein [Actinomycetota bacterium]|nr:CapA family protein [Actinomycetota bacterium]
MLAAISLALVLVVLAASIAWAMTEGRHRIVTDAREAPAAAPSGASPSARASAGPSPSSGPLRTVTIAAVGDTMLGNTPDLPPSPSTYLSAIRSALRAPIVFGNLEGTLTDQSVSKCATPTPTPTASRPPVSGSPSAPPAPPTCFAFRVPPSYATYLAQAGFTVMNHANNHSLDFGYAGLEDTLAALRGVHIANTGLPGHVAVVTQRGVRVAFVGFAPYGYTASLLDLPAARALIRTAAERADVVVVYMHAGAEGAGETHVTGREEVYDGEDRGNPRAFAHMAVDAGADLVIASGPHVLRGMEFYRHRLIAYSLGNFAGYQDYSVDGVLGISAVLRVTMASDGAFVVARLVPVRLVGAGQPEPDPSDAAIRLVQSLSKKDFGPHAARISAGGVISSPG